MKWQIAVVDVVAVMTVCWCCCYQGKMLLLLQLNILKITTYSHNWTNIFCLVLQNVLTCHMGIILDGKAVNIRLVSLVSLRFVVQVLQKFTEGQLNYINKIQVK